MCVCCAVCAVGSVGVGVDKGGDLELSTDMTATIVTGSLAVASTGSNHPDGSESEGSEGYDNLDVRHK